MNSVAEIAEAAPRPNLDVQDREVLWSGGIVEIRVPEKASEGVYDRGEIEVPFLQFRQTKYIHGGVVNFFVHTDDTSLRGSSIRAEVSVCKKVMADGRQFLHLDFKPVDAEPTHTLDVCGRGATSRGVHMPGGDTHVFYTPLPLQGMIVIVPIATEKPAPTKGSGDQQLDRLLAAGWKIGKEDAKTVTLVKEGKKPLTHHKPRR